MKKDNIEIVFKNGIFLLDWKKTLSKERQISYTKTLFDDLKKIAETINTSFSFINKNEDGPYPFFLDAVCLSDHPDIIMLRCEKINSSKIVLQKYEELNYCEIISVFSTFMNVDKFRSRIEKWVYHFVNKLFLSEKFIFIYQKELKIHLSSFDFSIKLEN